MDKLWSKDNEEAIHKYLGPRIKGKEFYETIQKHAEDVAVVYRGSAYNVNDLHIGAKYEPWDVTSWSIDKQVAINFADEFYIPEDLLSDVANDLGVSMVEAIDRFEQVVFVWEDAKGFVVNKHVQSHPYEKENEVIVEHAAFQIVDIKKPEGELKYHEVKVKAI